MDEMPKVEWRQLTPTGRALLAEVRSEDQMSDAILWEETAYNGISYILARIDILRRRFRLKRLALRQVPAVEFLGWGISEKQGSQKTLVLLSRQPPDGVELQVFFRDYFPSLAVGEKRRLVTSVAVFLRELHQKGVTFSGQFGQDLAVASDQNGMRFFLRGKMRCRFVKGPLSESARLADLVGLFGTFVLAVSRCQLMRFLRAYLGSTVFVDQGRQWFGLLEQPGRKAAMIKWRQRAGHCLQAGPDFSRENRDGFRIWRVRSAAARQAMEALLPDPDCAFDGAVIYKLGSRTHAGLVQLAGKRYFLKRYNYLSGWRYQVLNMARRSRAVRAWHVAWGLTVRGLAVAQPLLCLEERCFGFLRRGYVLMEFVPGSNGLWNSWPQLSDQERRQCLFKAGLIIGRMHYSGALHCDLKWNNILLRDGEPTQVWLVDFDGARICGHLTRKRARLDLERFLRDLRCHDSTGALLHFVETEWSRWTQSLQ